MMDKLISQQAAIEAVSEITTTMSVCTNKDECYGMKRMQKQAITELSNLPSAQPDTTTHDSIPAETGENDGDGTSGDCISRTQAIDTIEKHLKWTTIPDYYPGIFEAVRGWLNGLPSAQPAQSEMIKEIRRWINSGNRGNADYFIVDRIEEIINEYEIN